MFIITKTISLQTAALLYCLKMETKTKQFYPQTKKNVDVTCTACTDTCYYEVFKSWQVRWSMSPVLPSRLFASCKLALFLLLLALNFPVLVSGSRSLKRLILVHLDSLGRLSWRWHYVVSCWNITSYHIFMYTVHGCFGRLWDTLYVILVCTLYTEFVHRQPKR